MLAVTGDPVRAQCAMCQSSVEATDSSAFNQSTYRLLAVPYLLVGGIFAYVVYASRSTRSAAKKEEEETIPGLPSQEP